VRQGSWQGPSPYLTAPLCIRTRDTYERGWLSVSSLVVPEVHDYKGAWLLGSKVLDLSSDSGRCCWLSQYCSSCPLCSAPAMVVKAKGLIASIRTDRVLWCPVRTALDQATQAVGCAMDARARCRGVAVLHVSHVRNGTSPAFLQATAAPAAQRRWSVPWTRSESSGAVVGLAQEPSGTRSGSHLLSTESLCPQDCEFRIAMKMRERGRPWASVTRQTILAIVIGTV
jgi:hypothetical protein